MEKVAERAGMTLEQAREAAGWIMEASKDGKPLLTAAALREVIDSIPPDRLERCTRLIRAIIDTVKGVEE